MYKPMQYEFEAGYNWSILGKLL